jgi:hypothetical protein
MRWSREQMAMIDFVRDDKLMNIVSHLGGSGLSSVPKTL